MKDSSIGKAVASTRLIINCLLLFPPLLLHLEIVLEDPHEHLKIFSTSA